MEFKLIISPKPHLPHNFLPKVVSDIGVILMFFICLLNVQRTRHNILFRRLQKLIILYYSPMTNILVLITNNMYSILICSKVFLHTDQI